MVVVVIAMPRHISAEAGRAAVRVAVLLGAGAVLAGCGDSVAGSTAPQPAPAAAPAGYDISKIDGIKDDFPAGFTAESHPAKTLEEADIAGSGVAGFIDAGVDPPQCRSVVIPPYADPKAGTQAAGVIGQGEQGNMYVIALRSPDPIAAEDAPAGCDRITLSGSPEATGSVERIPAPQISGVTTTGVRLSVDGPDEDPDYLYTAALDEHTSIVVMGSADEQLGPQQQMSDLLVKAVAALRGQQQP